MRNIIKKWEKALYRHDQINKIEVIQLGQTQNYIIEPTNLEETKERPDIIKMMQL